MEDFGSVFVLVEGGACGVGRFHSFDTYRWVWAQARMDRRCRSAGGSHGERMEWTRPRHLEHGGRARGWCTMTASARFGGVA